MYKLTCQTCLTYNYIQRKFTKYRANIKTYIYCSVMNKHVATFLKHVVQTPLSFCNLEGCDTVSLLYLSFLCHCFASKVFSVIPYTCTQSVAAFASLHCSLSMHITLASLSSSDLALHAFLTPSSHLVRGLPLSLLPST